MSTILYTVSIEDYQLSELPFIASDDTPPITTTEVAQPLSSLWKLNLRAFDLQ